MLYISTQHKHKHSQRNENKRANIGPRKTLNRQRPRCIKFAFERKSEKSNANWFLTNQNRALRTCVWFFRFAFKRKFYATGPIMGVLFQCVTVPWNVCHDGKTWMEGYPDMRGKIFVTIILDRISQISIKF